MTKYKILGTGSYGCVVSPGYKCSKKNFDASKFVEYNEDRMDIVEREIKISKIISRLKTKNFNPDDYYCLIKESCFVDINKLSIENKSIYKNCSMNAMSRYKSLQADNCGVDMLYQRSKKTLFKRLSDHKKMYNCVLNLLIGLKHLHKKNIIVCDIKPENLMLKDDKIKYLDFGGSIIYDSKKSTPLKNFSFTRGFIPPEVVYLISYKKFYFYSSLKSRVAMLSELDENNSYFSAIFDIFYSNKNFESYFKKTNGAFKFDVYSLGLSLKEIISVIEYKNDKLNDLLLKMTDINFARRYDIDECLKHPYITEDKLFKPVIKTSTKVVKKTKKAPKEIKEARRLQNKIDKVIKTSPKVVKKTKKAPKVVKKAKAKTIPKEIKEARKLQNMIDKVIRSKKVYKLNEKCDKFKTNKGKRCPECCSEKSHCVWISKQGCKIKKNKKDKKVEQTTKIPIKKRKTRKNKGIPRKPYKKRVY